MVKKADIERCKKELALLSEQMGVPLFRYDEIHKPMDGQVANYDYNRFIDDYARYYEGIIRAGLQDEAYKKSREEVKKKLIDLGFLLPVSNGEYVVKFDEEVRLDKKTQAKNGCVFVHSLEKAKIGDIQEVYQKFAEEYAKKKDVFSGKELDGIYEKFSLDKSMQDKEKVEDYKQYLESSFGAAYAYAHTLATVGKGSMKKAKKAGMGSVAEGCNDEILKEVRRVVKEARRDGTLRGFATQGFRWLKEKVTGKEDDRLHLSKEDIFDANGNVKISALRDITAQIVKDKAQHPDLYAGNLSLGKTNAKEKAERRAESRFWRTIDKFNEKRHSFKRWKNRNVLFSKDARLDSKLRKSIKKDIKRKIVASSENIRAAEGMDKIVKGMQLLTLQSSMDPLSGELLKIRLKNEIESGNTFDKDAREAFVEKFIEDQKRLGKETVSKSDLKQFLKVVEKAIDQNSGNTDFDRLVTYMDRPNNEIQKAVDTAVNHYDNFVSAEYVPTERVSPLMGANYEQTKVFIEAGVDVMQRDALGKTALHYAKDPETVSLLCETNPNLIKAKDNQGRTAVHDARNTDIIVELANNGADLSEPDNNGKTAAHLASDYKTLKVLSQNGARLDVVDNDGNTPLMTNTSYGKIKAIEEEIKDDDLRKVYFNQKNNDGKSVADLVTGNEDLAVDQKTKMLTTLSNKAEVDYGQMLKNARDGNDVNMVMQMIDDLAPEKKLELISGALSEKVSLSKIEALKDICENNGFDKKAVFDHKDAEGKTPLVNVLLSNMPAEQKKTVSMMLHRCGADTEYAVDFVKKQKAKEEKLKQEQEIKRQKEAADKNKQEEKTTGEKQSLGEVFAKNPNLSVVYSQLITGKSEEKIKAITEAFQSIDISGDKKAGIEDKIFTKLLSSKAFSDKEKEVFLDKLVKAEHKRLSSTVLEDGTKVESLVDKKNKSEVLKFTYKDGSSIEFSKNDSSVVKKYKDDKGKMHEVKLVGDQAKKLQTDLFNLKDKGLSGQAKELPRLFDEAKKVQNKSNTVDKQFGTLVVNQMRQGIGG